MGNDTTTAQPVEAPALQPLSLTSRLADAPKNKPRYPRQILNRAGEAVTLADPVINRALVALMNVHAVNGGAACHWGGPAALAEIMSAVHGVLFAVQDRPWHEAYNFVNDAGHTENGIYALRANYGFDGLTLQSLRGFRSIESKLTGHGESHLNPEGVLLSNGPLGSAVPQSQGLAMADKTAGRNRVTLCVMSDGAAMEGEAKETFASLPGFASRGLVNPYVLIISDNNTKLSGRIGQDSFDMSPTFEGLAALGWRVLKIENGHDLTQVYHTLEQALHLAKKDPEHPVCLWAKTIKGYGVKSTMDSASGGHGFPLANGEKIIDFVQEICGNQVPEELMAWAQELRAQWEEQQAKKASAPASPAPSVKKDKVQVGISKAMIQAAQEGLPVFSISADLQGSTGVATFQKTFPERFLDVGVAESNMISVAAGYSKAGFIPVVDTFGQFGVTKGNLPLTMAALSQAPVIAIFSHVGFQDAADGASHQATAYLSATCSLPHTTVICPSCADEAEVHLLTAIRTMAEQRSRGEAGESTLFFIGRENFPMHFEHNRTYAWGKPQLMKQGQSALVVATGALVGKALQASEILEKEGVHISVMSHSFVNRIDAESFSQELERCGGRLVTLEDHQVLGGMGSLLAHALSGSIRSMKSLGMQGEFGQSAYLADQLYAKHGMDAPAVVEAVKSLL